VPETRQNNQPQHNYMASSDIEQNIYNLVNSLTLNGFQSGTTIEADITIEGEVEVESDEEIYLSLRELNEITCVDLWQNFEKPSFSPGFTGFTGSGDDNGDVNQEPDACSICKIEFAPLNICRQINSCQHIFHCACIDMWLSSNNTCPMCRHDLSGDVVLSSRVST
jgi:hypothetical protein